MLTTQEKKEVIEKISRKKKEVQYLQTELISVNDKKETYFKQKTEMSDKISKLINEIKKARTIRDELTKQVKKEKQSRDNHNIEVKGNVEKLKSLVKERDEVLKKHNIKDPTNILRQISRIEEQIETEPMSFDAEKKLMKKIKDLKKKLSQAQAVSKIIGTIRDISKVTDEKKKTAQQSHKKVQSQKIPDKYCSRNVWL